MTVKVSFHPLDTQNRETALIKKIIIKFFRLLHCHSNLQNLDLLNAKNLLGIRQSNYALHNFHDKKSNTISRYATYIILIPVKLTFCSSIFHKVKMI